MSLVLTEELEPGILLVTMNRPERLNALSQGLIAELHATFERINTDRSVRVVILTGAGRGFCSGDDLKGVEGEHGAPGTEGMNQIPLILLNQAHLASLHERIHRLRQPVIAAVNGVAVGGGFAMKWASCDIRSAPNRRAGSVFITLGVVV
jgi:enoyl-CoA hydratase/carnithine racemase